MNILFYRYGSICEPDLMDAFSEYGIHVDQLTQEMTNKQLLPTECVTIVSEALAKGNYSFVFSINFFPAVSSVCNIYHIPYLCLIVDSPVIELYSNALANPCNRVFLFDRALYQEFHSVNPDCIFHIPLATNVAKKDALIQMTSRADFVSQLSFVGSLYTEKCHYDAYSPSSPYFKGYFQGLMEAQLQVYGCYFIEELLTPALVEEFVLHTKGFFEFPDQYNKNQKALVAQHYLGSKITAMERIQVMELLSKNFPLDLYTASNTQNLPSVNNRGTVKTLTEMPLVFHQSQINLNMTAKSIRSGIPLRVFDVLGSGGFLISNYQSELPEQFTPGDHLDVYTSLEDLEEKTAFYLEHPQICRAMAEAGREYILQHHTFTIRLGQMIQLAFQDQ